VRTAERLMAIARNPVLSKSDNLSLLPPSFGTFLFSEPSRDRLEAGSFGSSNLRASNELIHRAELKR